MKHGWPTLLVTVLGMLACGAALHGDRRSSAAPEAAITTTQCRRDEHVTIELVKQVEECESRLKASETAQTQETAQVRSKVVPGPPKRCAVAGPEIVPVPTSQCATGLVCLDDKGQRALARNLAAYEAWVRQMLDCEGAK